MDTDLVEDISTSEINEKNDKMTVQRVVYIGDGFDIEIPSNHFVLDIALIYSNRSIYTEIDSYISTNRNPVIYIPDVRILPSEIVRELIAILKMTPSIGVIAFSDSDTHVHPLLRYFLHPIRSGVVLKSSSLLGFIESTRGKTLTQQEKRIIEYCQELSDLGFIGDVSPYYKRLIMN
jgi:hypothetical protein